MADDIGGRESAGAPISELAQRALCPARHCWVAQAVDSAGVQRPGLLLEWRQGPAGWEGLVIYAMQVRGQRWGLLQEWLPAALLTSA